MILRHVAPIVHGAPVLPVVGLSIDGRIPDLLAPNDILELEVFAVMHDPFGYLLARQRGNLSFFPRQS